MCIGVTFIDPKVDEDMKAVCLGMRSVTRTLQAKAYEKRDEWINLWAKAAFPGGVGLRFLDDLLKEDCFDIHLRARYLYEHSTWVDLFPPVKREE